MIRCVRQILIVDDNPGDAGLMEQAIAEAGFTVDVRKVENAIQAFTFLRHKPIIDLPSVIILDLCMPVIDGIEALRIIKGSPTLAGVPVVVFTSSSRAEDRDAALMAGATCVHTKPPTWQGYVALARALAHYLGDGLGDCVFKPETTSKA